LFGPGGPADGKGGRSPGLFVGRPRYILAGKAMALGLVVLMQLIADPQVLVTAAEVKAWEGGDPESHPVFGPYDENALESA
jgi:hypothetical protein